MKLPDGRYLELVGPYRVYLERIQGAWTFSVDGWYIEPQWFDTRREALQQAKREIDCANGCR